MKDNNNDLIYELRKENEQLKEELARLREKKIISEKSCFNEDEVFKNSEIIYKLLFDNMFSAFILCEIIFDNTHKPTDFLFLDTNKSFNELINLSRNQIIGKKVSDLNIEPLYKNLSKFSEVALRNIGIEFTLNFNKLSKHYHIYSYCPKKNQFAAIFVDITQKAQKESILKDNLSFSQKLIDAIPTPVFYKDASGKYLLCNKSYSEQILGVEPQVIIGKSALELEEYFPKEFADFYQEKDLELLKKQEIQVYEGKIKCADGQIKEFIVNKTIIKNQDQSVGILGVMQDVDNLKNIQKELKDSEKKYHTLFDGIMHPIFVTDLDSQILILNKKAQNLINLPEKNLVGEKLIDVVPNLKTEDLNRLKEVAKTGRIIIQEDVLDTKIGKKWYLTSIQPIYEIFGEVSLQIIAYDITNIKRYQEQLIESKKRIEESDRLKSIFLENLSHEIRTPMNAIHGFSQLIKINQSVDKMQQYVDVIYTNSRKLLNIIDDIVEISMIETNQLQIKQDISDLNTILTDCYAIIEQEKNEMQKDHIKLKQPNRIDDNKALVFIDSNRIIQIFRKLLINALIYTEKGFVEFGVYQIDKNKIEFYVKDSGIGISDDKSNIIFERFRQIDEGSTRKYGGTGLGLSIAKELVNKMGGDIYFKSKLNAGSAFFFTIPYKSANAAKHHYTIKDYTKIIGNKKVLIVEDEYSNYLYLKEILEDVNAKVYLAENGEQAIKKCQTLGEIDCILMDIQLPGMNGFDVTKKIREKFHSIPIIAQTAHALEDDKIEAYNAGCDVHLSKPIDFNELLKSITNLLEKKKKKYG